MMITLLRGTLLQQVVRSPVADTLILLSVPPTPLLLAGVDRRRRRRRRRRVFPEGRTDGRTSAACGGIPVTGGRSRRVNVGRGGGGGGCGVAEGWVGVVEHTQ